MFTFGSFIHWDLLLAVGFIKRVVGSFHGEVRHYFIRADALSPYFFYESYPSVAPVLIQYIEPPSGSAGECVTSHWFKLSSLEMLSSIVDSKTEFVWRPYVAPKAGVEYS